MLIGGPPRLLSFRRQALQSASSRPPASSGSLTAQKEAGEAVSPPPRRGCQARSLRIVDRVAVVVVGRPRRAVVHRRAVPPGIPTVADVPVALDVALRGLVVLVEGRRDHRVEHRLLVLR